MTSFGWGLEQPQPFVFDGKHFAIATQMAVLDGPEEMTERTMVFLLPVDGTMKPIWRKLTDIRPMTGQEYSQMQQTGQASISKLTLLP